jgi:hypothetical protein
MRVRVLFLTLVGLDSFPYGGREFRLRRWSMTDQATRAAMRYYVKICLEGLPLHLWSESFATAVLGRSCLVHYAEEHSGRRESTEIFELMAWSVDLTAIPLRVWLTVLDLDRSSRGSPVVTIHRQCPSEPKRGMVYEVILHVLTIEDTRCHGPDGRPLFYLFRFNLGSADEDQSVAPAPAPWARNQVQGNKQRQERRPARHSCSAEYWRPRSRSDDEDEDDPEGRGGRSFAPQPLPAYSLAGRQGSIKGALAKVRAG